MWRARVVRKLRDIDALHSKDVDCLCEAADLLIAALATSERQKAILQGLLQSKLTQAHRDQVFADAEPLALKLEAGIELVMSAERQQAALAAMINRVALMTRPANDLL